MANFAEPDVDCWIEIVPYDSSKDPSIIHFYKPGGEGSWREESLLGPIEVGDKNHMGYLTPADLLQWSRKDFKHGYSCNVNLILTEEELYEKYGEELE